MNGLRTAAFTAGLDVLYATRAHRLFAARWQGLGAIFMLHHIKPAFAEPGQDGFRPNAPLSVTPQFLDAVLADLKARGIAPVSLAEAVSVLRAGRPAGRIAVFTIDDGYRDNLEHALPVFAAHACPFTVFVTTGIVEATTELWWLGLEQVIARHDEIEIDLEREQEGVQERHRTESTADKTRAFWSIYWRMRGLDEYAQRRFIRALCERYRVDLAALCRSEAMTWDEVRTLASHRLATIGAHTVDHFALAKLPEEQAVRELTESRARIARETGATPAYFCYPYGDPGSAGARDFRLAREAGFEAAVTTRKGLLYREHGAHLHALPRVSLNGSYQSLRYIDLYLSGAPFALWNRFRRLDVA